MKNNNEGRAAPVAESGPTHDAWKRPIYYTDTINARQVCRDDLWAITTDELRALDSFVARARATMVGTDGDLRGCNACSWEGKTDRMCGGVGPLCPECGETTEALDAPAAPQPVDAAQAVPKQCGACGANVGERCRTMSDDQCDAGKYVAPVAQPTDTTKGA